MASEVFSMAKNGLLFAIRVLVSLNLLYAAIFLKFAGAPLSVAAFTAMSNATHGLISQPVFRIRSGVIETLISAIVSDSENCQIRRRADSHLDVCCPSQSHFCAGLWLALCGCARDISSSMSLSLPDAHAI
jgi:hypothetical protein